MKNVESSMCKVMLTISKRSLIKNVSMFVLLRYEMNLVYVPHGKIEFSQEHIDPAEIVELSKLISITFLFSSGVM